MLRGNEEEQETAGKTAWSYNLDHGRNQGPVPPFMRREGLSEFRSQS